MDSLSTTPSVSDQARDINSIKNKFLLPRKPARQPNPIIYRRLRRGSAAAAIIPGKQTECPTNKELLRTIAYLRNATAVLYEPDKTLLPYHKAYINDGDDEEEITEDDDEEHNTLHNDEKCKQELEMSIQNYSKSSIHTLTKKGEKKSSQIFKGNKECGLSSSTSHVVVNFKDINNETSDHHGQGLAKQE